MKFLIKLVAMAALLFLAMTTSHFLIYKTLIVPRLPSLQSVPFYWWLGAFAPMLLVFLVFGISLKSWRELIIFSILAGTIQQVFGYLMSTWNEPGNLKSFESPIFEWTIGVVAAVVISAVFFSIGMLMVRLMKRNLKSPDTLDAEQIVEPERA